MNSTSATAGRFAEAFRHVREGAARHQNGDVHAAQALYRQALALEPQLFDALHLLGLCQAQSGDYPQAAELLAKALAVNPNHAAAHNNHGNVLKELGHQDGALRSYERAAMLKPDYAEPHYNSGALLSEREDYEAALASYDRALALRPDYLDARYSRGVVLQKLKRLDEARAEYEWVIVQRPDHAYAHCNASLVNLLQGDFARGFPGYEWRWKNDRLLYKVRRDFAAPLWLGRESLDGKTILLHAEQGLGDTIQFCRYAKFVRQRGARVILEVQPPLMGLLRHLEGIDQLLAQGEELPPFDYHCPLLSLPLAFNTTVATIPAANHYLAAEPEKLAQWRAQLGPKLKPQIGIVWSTTNPVSAGRNVEFSAFQRVLSADWQLNSLQKVVSASEAPLLAATPDIVHWGDRISDFTDTAALCALMDLVISIDTSIVHVAGALGRPLWVLLPFVNDWRWQLDRSDSPWYPSAVLYRQPAPGAWEPVLESVAHSLRHRFASAP